MTDIQLYEQQATTPALVRRGTDDLVSWAEEAKAAFGIAQSLANTSFVPRAFANKPHEITAAILTGRELGMEPMAALRNIHVIQGTPALSANALRGLALARGHQIWVDSSGPTKVVVKGQRAGSEHVQTVTWTIQRAEQLGLPNRNPQYKLQPEAMLTARATADMVRLVAADVLLGAPYAVEELDTDTEPLAEAPTRKVKRAKPAPPPVPEPDFPEPEAGQPVDEHAAAWERVVNAGWQQGWDRDRCEKEFADWSDGTAPGAADAAQLDNFVQWMGGE